MIHHLSKHDTRDGFTLIELLMVMAIIATLMAMSVVVMLGFMDQAEEEATSATLQKLARLVEQRSEAIDRAFSGVRAQRTIQATYALLTDPNNDGDRSDGIFGVREEAVRILAKKAMMRFEMPQRFEERLLFGDAAVSVSGMPQSIYLAIAAPRARNTLGLAVTTPLTDPVIISEVASKWANNQAETESSELLYFCLIASGSFGATSVDSDRFTDAEIQDTDNDGLPEFVDAWGQPLRFYRWPTRLVDWDPPVPFQPVLSDANDPTDVIVNVDTDADGTPDTTVGQRAVSQYERNVANILLKGLPPAPSMLPNGVLPRDLLLTDPDDPIGTLYSELERLDGTNGNPLFRSQYNEALFHTPDTFHSPLVVSAGLDNALGLREPNDTANFGNLAAYDADLDGNGTAGQPADFDLLLDVLSDNLTSRSKLAGGR
jgi:prepilin-type N-terminal cleavage/methylation domain-containing protein